MSRNRLNAQQIGSLQNITLDQLEQSIKDILTNSSTEYHFIDCSAGTQLVQLPDPNQFLTAVKTHYIKKIDSSSNMVLISSLGTNKTIDGQTSISISSQYDSYTLKSYNGQWYIV